MFKSALKTPNCRIRMQSSSTLTLNQFHLGSFNDRMTEVMVVSSPVKKAETNVMKSIWKLTRPHTIIGTLMSVTSVFMYAVPYHKWLSMNFFEGLLGSLIPSLLMNLFVTGLNQLTDVEIDKVNKPYLPLASGELSMQQGTVLVVGSLLLSLFLARNSPWPLQWTLLSTALLGTLYSLPPFRLKRFPLLAAVCILAVRGSLINIGFFLQAKSVVLRELVPSLSVGIKMYPEMLPVTAFFAVYGCVIALMKDVPDIKGDAANKISSFSVRLGADTMFR